MRCAVCALVLNELMDSDDEKTSTRENQRVDKREGRK